MGPALEAQAAPTYAYYYYSMSTYYYYPGLTRRSRPNNLTPTLLRL